MIEEIKKTINGVLDALGFPESVTYTLELPPSGIDFDLATNVALVAGTKNKQNPRELAEQIAKDLEKSDILLKAEVAGPGFINIKISDAVLASELENVQASKGYGSNNEGKDKTVCVEYISANPTGQVHIGNARGGPIGEAIANLYEYFGYNAVRRFYVNDIGGQVEKLASTFYYYYEISLGQKVEFPEGGYPGEYIELVATEIIEKYKKELSEFKDKSEILPFLKEKGLQSTVENIKREVALLGIKFDHYDYQSEIEESGKAEAAITRLEESGATTQKEGALWFKNPGDPDVADKEAVLRKSDGDKTLTYFADDVAYHIEKYEQNYEMIVDVLGSNHHGHLPRMRAVTRSLGYDVDKLKVILYQFVQLKNGEEIMKMSKRMGNFVTLSQVINGGVTADAFKYFILSQNNDTPIDFDVKLASERSEKNPVFYIQYAHARISSILRKAEISAKLDILKLNQDIEHKIIKNLIIFPELLAEVKESYQIQKIAHYTYGLSSLFHEYYSGTQILIDDKETSASRLFLIECVKQVLSSALTILDIDAPEKM